METQDTVTGARVNKTEFNSDNEDMRSASAYWYDRDAIFIEQVETGEKARRELLLIGREGVPHLIEILQDFLNH